MLPALVLIAAAPARAEPVAVHYEAYAGGLNAVSLDAEIDVAPDRYRVRLRFRTVGTAGVMFPSNGDTVVVGTFHGGRPAPSRVFSTGAVRGTPRVTQIDYQDGAPRIRRMEPPEDVAREPVPDAARAGTIDVVSAMADLVRQVNMTGRCDGRVTTFDGRRLSELEARTAGQQTLPPSNRSSFSGPALRCEITGRQTGGFALDADRTKLPPLRGSAWFAAIAPGGPMIPVRIAFATRFFGDATLYLTSRE